MQRASGLAAETVFHHLLIAEPENRGVARGQISHREDEMLSPERETSRDCAGTCTHCQLPRNSFATHARGVPAAFSKYGAVIAVLCRRNTNYHYVALLRRR